VCHHEVLKKSATGLESWRNFIRPTPQTGAPSKGPCAVIHEKDTQHATTFGLGNITPQTYLDWRQLQEPFQQLAAVGGTQFRLKTEGSEPADARGQRVTAEFFPVLRVAPRCEAGAAGFRLPASSSLSGSGVRGTPAGLRQKARRHQVTKHNFLGFLPW